MSGVGWAGVGALNGRCTKLTRFGLFCAVSIPDVMYCIIGRMDEYTHHRVKVVALLRMLITLLKYKTLLDVYSQVNSCTALMKFPAM